MFFWGWTWGSVSPTLDFVGFITLFTSRVFSILQSGFPFFTHVWISKQIGSSICFKDCQTLIQFERSARTIFWQSFALFMFGICEISVIIPTLNEEKYISRCLDSLKKQEFDGRFEIIVVDGGSNDSTVDLVNAQVDKVVVYKGKPVGDSRNLGAKFAEAEMVAFIDADTMASKSWLSNIRESLSWPRIVGVTGPTLPYEGSELDRLAYKVATGWLQRFSMLFGLPHVAGFNCAYRRGSFLNCGGFEEGRTLSEDLALSRARNLRPDLFQLLICSAASAS